MDRAYEPAPPHLSYARLFGRFLRFGLLAWGGPVAQIAMLRQELVEDEQWIDRGRFNRVLAIYQALPGPEAHELCVYFGMLARGRPGGIVAGLGFMLPGFGLMLLLSWLYLRYGIASPVVAGVFYGAQPAVAALIVRAAQRIGAHALTDVWLWLIAIAALLAHLAGVHFAITLALAALVYGGRDRWRSASPLVLVALAPGMTALQTAIVAPTVVALFGYGLRAGLLTFGGAYTAIPILQHDAVITGGWMTDAQFLDGIAIGNLLPAPLIIFSTFVGYVGGGLAGALAITLGVFLPAFAFTLAGHTVFERIIDTPRAHALLDGVMAGVVGIIAATAFGLARAALTDAWRVLIFGCALLVLLRWRARSAPAFVVLGAGVAGWLLTLW